MNQALSASLPAPVQTSRAMLWTGRVLTAVISALLLMGASMAILRVPQAVEGTVQLGYPAAVVFPLGLVQLVSLALYLYPRTSVLGAILWTGYFGGAVATHVRLGEGLGTILTPAIAGAILWLALWLRDARLRALVPVRRDA
jgi:hypothetical protein